MDKLAEDRDGAARATPEATARRAAIRVDVVGASGKVARLVCAAVIEDDALELVAAVARSGAGSPMAKTLGRNDVRLRLSDRLDALTRAKVEVGVDFTRPDEVMSNARWYAAHRLHAVIRTGGISSADLDETRDLQSRSGRTASPDREMVCGVRGGEVGGIRVHALRLTGAPAPYEVRFAHRGDTLTLALTNHDRAEFAGHGARHQGGGLTSWRDLWSGGCFDSDDESSPPDGGAPSCREVPPTRSWSSTSAIRPHTERPSGPQGGTVPE